MFDGLSWVRLHESPWQSWAEFRRTIGSMDLNLQPSFTETFNIVTADSVAEGVPAVVSHAVDWAPDSWKADPDDIADITRIGSALLSSTTGAEEGLRALERYLEASIAIWKAYLGGDPRGIQR
jgi:hypothetical protein